MRQVRDGKEEIFLNTVMKLRSGVTIPRMSVSDAEKKNYLTRSVLEMMHLMPVGDPAAFDENEDGSVTYFFDPKRVTEAPPEMWYAPTQQKTETMTLENGAVITRMSTKRAAA